MRYAIRQQTFLNIDPPGFTSAYRVARKSITASAGFLFALCAAALVLGVGRTVCAQGFL